ncbi:MAG: ATP-binding cassette domain-containing protein [Desulfobacterales bacterium]|nr:ATP-binding cassette domain-containing protein [Desulfobacterales bacterium]
MKKYFNLLNGPNTIGNSTPSWVIFSVILALFLLYPLFGSRFMASNISLFVLYVPIAFGLSLLWGYCGVLSFGQMAFFGISGYVYGIIAANFQAFPGGTWIALVAGIVATVLMAGFFAYFVFYGQVSSWIIPVLTLVLTLVMETFMGQTAGYQWKVGNALLGGYNGMTNIPSIKVGPVAFMSGTYALYYLIIGSCGLIYLALRVLINSKWGSIIVAIREDLERTRTVGHNVNLIQVLVFVLAASLAGLSGVFYVSWGNYIDPSTMGLISATMPVVWVCVGGRESFLAVLMSTIVLGYVADLLSVYGGQYAFLVSGALLLVVMLFYPQGIFVSIARRFETTRRQKDADARGAERIEIGKTISMKRAAAKVLSEATPTGHGLILQGKRLSKSFGGIEAIRDLSFEMERGELRCLIGPNGAGKSTFFNLLTGLYSPDSGEIYFKNEPITTLPSFQRIRRGISLKFQTTRTYQNLTVAENLQIPYQSMDERSETRDRLGWAFEAFGLNQLMDHPVKGLSHGHQQWLEICLALATDPELLLLDEPTTGMTPEETSHTAEFVKVLNEIGISVLVVEHDMAFVRQITSKVTVLHHGCIFAEGSLPEIESNKEVRRIYLGE